MDLPSKIGLTLTLAAMGVFGCLLFWFGAERPTCAILYALLIAALVAVLWVAA